MSSRAKRLPSLSLQTLLVVTTFPVVKGLPAHKGPTLLPLHLLPPLNMPPPSLCWEDAAPYSWSGPSDPSHVSLPPAAFRAVVLHTGCKRHRLGNSPAVLETWYDPWVGKIPWRRQWQSTPVFLPGESPWTEESMGSQRIGHN